MEAEEKYGKGVGKGQHKKERLLKFEDWIPTCKSG